MIIPLLHRAIALLMLFSLTGYAAKNASGQVVEFPAPDSLVVVDRIVLEGNRITRDHIIARELVFAVGDTLSISVLRGLIESSRENLQNTLLFNFVDAKIKLSGKGIPGATITFMFTERWYVWPWPVIDFADRNFNTWWSENRDLSRMSYGIALKWENFRGRKENLEFTAIFGYEELYGFDYTIPYLNREETIGLAFGASYGRSGEVPVKSEHDKLVYYKDDDDVIDVVSARMNLIIRKAIYNTHVIRLAYDNRNFDDTLLAINPAFSVGNSSNLQYLTLAYQFKSDHRDYRAYPLEGYYFDAELGKHGLGLLDNGGLDVFYASATFRKYFRLSGRWFYASGLNARFSNDREQPFFMNRAIGYGRDIVRGYEYYVVHGNNFGIFKNNVKFALLPTRTFNIDFIRSEKFSRVHYAFYLNAFIDMGYADNLRPLQSAGNELENTLLVGYGLGLDLVTYYDIVVRIEYAFNRMNEHGLFLHFMAPI